MSSSITDSIIKTLLPVKVGKPGKILEHGVIYGKDKGVAKIDQTLKKHQERNRPINVSRAVAIRKKVDEHAQVEAAKFNQLINRLCDAAKSDAATSKVTTSDVSSNKLPIILPQVSENLSNPLK